MFEKADKKFVEKSIWQKLTDDKEGDDNDDDHHHHHVHDDDNDDDDDNNTKPFIQWAPCGRNQLLDQWINQSINLTFICSR